jgi:transcriptional regulator with XRE-family HTH domain
MQGDPVQAFGQVLREIRRQRGLSQEALAFESDLDRAFLSRLETGHKQPSLLTIFRIASVLHISVAELLRLVEDRIHGPEAGHK